MKTPEPQAPDENGAELKPWEKKLLAMKINETPALQAQYETHREYLNKALDALDSESLEEAKKKVRGYVEMYGKSSGEEGPYKDQHEREFFTLSDLEWLLNKLGSLRSLSNRDGMLKTMATRDLFRVAQGAHGAHISEVIDNAVWHLAQTIEKMAPLKFPKEYNEQVNQRREADRAALEKVRDDLMKKNVR